MGPPVHRTLILFVWQYFLNSEILFLEKKTPMEIDYLGVKTYLSILKLQR